MKDYKEISTYNDLKKKYKVMVTTIKEANKNPNPECVVLKKKTNINFLHKPVKHKQSRLDKIEEKLDLIIQRMGYFEQYCKQLFREHGWIK